MFRDSQWRRALLLAGLLAVAAAGAAAQGRLERIARAAALRVCIWPDYHGITWRDPKTQQLEGIDIDMALELGRSLGVAVQFVDSSFASLVDDVRGDRCDIAMFAIGITPERAEKLRFAPSHLQSDIHAITTRVNRRIREWADIDRPGVVVTVARGTYHEAVMKQRLGAATLKVVNTPQAREQEVQSGRADVFMTDYPYSRRLLAQADWARLVSPPGPYHLMNYAYAMAPGDDAFHERVSRFVEDIRRDGRLLASARRHGLEPIAHLR